MVLHLVQTFNRLSAFIVYDEDGAQKDEVIFVLEKIRRSLSVLRLFKARSSPTKLKNNVLSALNLVNSMLTKLG